MAKKDKQVDSAIINDNIGDYKNSQIKKVFTQRLNQLLSETDELQNAISISSGVSESNLTSYKKGTTEPKITALKGLADYFHVSTDYLLGNNEAKNLDINDMKISQVTGLSSDAIKLLQGLQQSKKTNQPLYSELIDVINDILCTPEFIAVLGDIANYNRSVKRMNEIKKDKGIKEMDQLLGVKDGSLSQEYNVEISQIQPLALFNIQKHFLQIVEVKAKERYDGK